MKEGIAVWILSPGGLQFASLRQHTAVRQGRLAGPLLSVRFRWFSSFRPARQVGRGLVFCRVWRGRVEEGVPRSSVLLFVLVLVPPVSSSPLPLPTIHPAKQKGFRICFFK